MIRLVYRRGSWFWRPRVGFAGSIVGPYPTAFAAIRDAYQIGGMW